MHIHLILKFLFAAPVCAGCTDSFKANAVLTLRAKFDVISYSFLKISSPLHSLNILLFL